MWYPSNEVPLGCISNKNNQVTLRHPLGSGHPNMGILQIGGKGGITDFNQCRCQDRGCSGLKRQSKCVVKEAKHNAGPRGGRG